MDGKARIVLINIYNCILLLIAVYVDSATSSCYYHSSTLALAISAVAMLSLFTKEPN